MKMIDDSRIDAAMDSYELATLPNGFTRKTMKRITTAEVEQPAFRLHFIDVALPLFALAFVTAMMLVGSYVLSSLKPMWYETILQQAASWVLELSQILPIFLVGIGVIGVTVTLMGLLLVTLISSRPTVRLKL